MQPTIFYETSIIYMHFGTFYYIIILSISNKIIFLARSDI